MKERRTYTYHVTMNIPNNPPTHAETDVVATSKEDAKYKATSAFFHHQFTGVHKYMKAEKVEQA